MKRLVIASLCFALAVPLMVSAQEAASITVPGNETSVSAGFEFGNTLEHIPDDGNSYFGSPGMTIDGYSFWNGKNFGIFFHSSFLIPVVGEDTHDFQWGWLIGPAFRVRFTDKVTLQTGIGLGGNGLHDWHEESDTYYIQSIYNFGIGVDAGLKFDITDTFFIKGGVNFAWTFLGMTNNHEKDGKNYMGEYRGNSEKNPSNYWSMNVNPYISFGMNIYSPKREYTRNERPRFGKPPHEEAAE
ncbi:hypothetical protein LQZ19_17610 [Treponema primitia]|uniref:hypothetical protein n=1 Tax=Treponema primitia TaxID=88058 RepID=UPI0039806DCB